MSCLVTKLKGEIKNDRLLFLGKSRVNVFNNSTAYAEFQIRVNVSKVCLYNCKGDLYYKNDGVYTELTPSGEDNHALFNSSTVTLYISAGGSAQFDVKNDEFTRIIVKAGNLVQVNNSDDISIAFEGGTVLETISFTSPQNIYGTLESLIERQWLNGRRSETIYFEIPSDNIGSVTFNDSSVAGVAHRLSFDTDYVQVKQGETVIGTFNGTTWTYA